MEMEQKGQRPILIISGTNRPASHALKIAEVLLGHYEAVGIAAEVYSLVDLPLEIFQPSAYKHKPAEFEVLQSRVLDARGIHLVVPDYNGSFPGVLKYFIDMLKFPESFDRKPVAFVGESNGQWGAMRAVEQLQMVLGYRNAFAYPERVFIPAVHSKVHADGKLSDEALNERLARQVRGFVGFMGCLVGK